MKNRDDYGNPMGGFLLLLHPHRRWVLRVSLVIIVGLVGWRLVTAILG